MKRVLKKWSSKVTNLLTSIYWKVLSDLAKSIAIETEKVEEHQRQLDRIFVGMTSRDRAVNAMKYGFSWRRELAKKMYK